MDTKYEPSRLIGPEDVGRGDYVTVSHETYEFVPSLREGCERNGLQPTRVTMVADHAGRPLRVVGVCQPFVLVEDARGKHRTVDLRLKRLARLSRAFGEEAFKRMRPKTRGNQLQLTGGSGI